MAVRFGATIEVISTGLQYNTWTDWGLTIESIVIGDPEQETNYIKVPGRSNLLDASEALTGEVVFKGRPIDIRVKKTGDPAAWDITVSMIRNLIDGRRVKITFDNDQAHYWEGRINIKSPERLARLGGFNMHAYVDAYKKNSAASVDVMNITDSYTLVIPKGDHAVVPTFKVQNITSQSLTMHSSSNDVTYDLPAGTRRLVNLKVAGGNAVTLTFTGSAKVTLTYRGESL